MFASTPLDERKPLQVAVARSAPAERGHGLPSQPSPETWQLERSRREIDLSRSVLPFAEVQRLEAVHLLYPIHERAFLLRV